MLTAILWKFVLALHIVSFVTWIGGNVFICLALFPSLKLLDKAQRCSVLLQSFKKYFTGVTHAFLTLFITGALLMYHIGHAALSSKGILGMAALAVVIAIIYLRVFTGPYTRARRSIKPQDELFLSIRRQLLIITALGILAIFCAILG